MTLLVLDLRPPSHCRRSTRGCARPCSRSCQLESYVINFLVLCVFWLAITG
jgi:uncharacterized membrane protein